MMNLQGIHRLVQNNDAGACGQLHDSDAVSRIDCRDELRRVGEVTAVVPNRLRGRTLRGRTQRRQWRALSRVVHEEVEAGEHLLLRRGACVRGQGPGIEWRAGAWLGGTGHGRAPGRRGCSLRRRPWRRTASMRLDGTPNARSRAWHPAVVASRWGPHAHAAPPQRHRGMGT